jgi:hypothetical protein
VAVTVRLVLYELAPVFWIPRYRVRLVYYSKLSASEPNRLGEVLQYMKYLPSDLASVADRILNDFLVALGPDPEGQKLSTETVKK